MCYVFVTSHSTTAINLVLKVPSFTIFSTFTFSFSASEFNLSSKSSRFFPSIFLNFILIGFSLDFINFNQLNNYDVWRDVIVQFESFIQPIPNSRESAYFEIFGSVPSIVWHYRFHYSLADSFARS